MKIIDFALDHSRTFIAILFFLIVAGTSTYINIPKEAAPDVNIPYIYISLSDNDPGHLRDFLDPVASEMECFNSSELVTIWKNSTDVKANWKTCLDAFMEVYHSPTIHKDTVNILLDGNGMAAGLLKNGLLGPSLTR